MGCTGLQAVAVMHATVATVGALAVVSLIAVIKREH
jgi:hypothetical protein